MGLALGWNALCPLCLVLSELINLAHKPVSPSLLISISGSAKVMVNLCANLTGPWRKQTFEHYSGYF